MNNDEIAKIIKQKLGIASNYNYMPSINMISDTPLTTQDKINNLIISHINLSNVDLVKLIIDVVETYREVKFKDKFDEVILKD